MCQQFCSARGCRCVCTAVLTTAASGGHRAHAAAGVGDLSQTPTILAFNSTCADLFADLFARACADLFARACADLFARACADLFARACADLFARACADLFARACADLFARACHGERRQQEIGHG